MTTDLVSLKTKPMQESIVANNVHVSKFIGMVFDDGEMISMDTISTSCFEQNKILESKKPCKGV